MAWEFSHSTSATPPPATRPSRYGRSWAETDRLTGGAKSSAHPCLPTAWGGWLGSLPPQRVGRVARQLAYPPRGAGGSAACLPSAWGGWLGSLPPQRVGKVARQLASPAR